MYTDLKETELETEKDKKIIIARIGEKKQIFVRDVCMSYAMVSYTCKVFVPKLGFISYKVEKKNGKIVKSATYVKPSKGDLSDAKKYNLPSDFMTYINHDTKSLDKDYDLMEPFWFFIDHTDENRNLVGFVRYAIDRGYKCISFVLPHIMSISKNYNVCMKHLSVVRGCYPFEKHSDEYIRCISEELEVQNDRRKEGDEDYDKVYCDNLCTLGEELEKDLKEDFEKELSHKGGDMGPSSSAQISKISFVSDEELHF